MNPMYPISLPGDTVIVSANLTPRLPNNPPASDQHSLVNDLTVYIFHVVFYVILSGIFGILGTVSNTINVIVFIRQGLFSSNSNVNLFFLAVSDLGVAVTTWLYSIGFSLIVADTTALTTKTWYMPDIMVVAVSRPHAVFVLATRVITAYVTFERFVCVVLPFRVKTWLTPQRSLFSNVTAFVYFTAWMLPIYATSWLGFKRQEGTNASTLVMVSSPKFGVIMDTFYFVNFLVVDLTSVLISLVCTVVTSAHIKISKEWRRQITSSVADVSSCSAAPQSIHNTTINSTTSPSKEKLSSNNTSVTKSDQKMTRSTIDKETRLVKMITIIAVLFLISYLPEVALSVLKMVDNRIHEFGQYHRLADVALSLIYVSSAINSTINILVYYSMSGKYRKEFRILFGLTDTNKC